MIISDREIEIAFLGTNFGTANHRELLEVSVLKKLVDYHCGYTITRIMQGLGLIGKTGKVTKKGKLFVREAYHEFMIGKGG